MECEMSNKRIQARRFPSLVCAVCAFALVSLNSRVLLQAQGVPPTNSAKTNSISNPFLMESNNSGGSPSPQGQHKIVAAGDQRSQISTERVSFDDFMRAVEAEERAHVARESAMPRRKNYRELFERPEPVVETNSKLGFPELFEDLKPVEDSGVPIEARERRQPVPEEQRRSVDPSFAEFMRSMEGDSARVAEMTAKPAVDSFPAVERAFRGDRSLEAHPAVRPRTRVSDARQVRFLLDSARLLRDEGRYQQAYAILDDLRARLDTRFEEQSPALWEELENTLTSLGMRTVVTGERIGVTDEVEQHAEAAGHILPVTNQLSVEDTVDQQARQAVVSKPTNADRQTTPQHLSKSFTKPETVVSQALESSPTDLLTATTPQSLNINVTPLRSLEQNDDTSTQLRMAGKRIQVRPLNSANSPLSVDDTGTMGDIQVRSRRRRMTGDNGKVPLAHRIQGTGLPPEPEEKRTLKIRAMPSIEPRNSERPKKFETVRAPSRVFTAPPAVAEVETSLSFEPPPPRLTVPFEQQTAEIVITPEVDESESNESSQVAMVVPKEAATGVSEEVTEAEEEAPAVTPHTVFDPSTFEAPRKSISSQQMVWLGLGGFAACMIVTLLLWRRR